MQVFDFEKPIEELERRIEELRRYSAEVGIDASAELAGLQSQRDKICQEVYAGLKPYERVLISRHPQRPYTLDYVRELCADFTELHGDRRYSDDQALVGGLADFRGRKVMVLGHQKGRSLKENLRRNFGMAHPEGYRKAMRLMEMASRFGLPIITFIDSPGAYPGVGAEERGQAEAIAVNLRDMMELEVPVVSAVIGEGGSGGALGIGVCNRLLILSNAYYNVISPEAGAAILFHDAGKAPETAAAMKLTAQDILRFGIADEIVEEPLGGAHRDPAAAARALGDALERQLADLEKLSGSELREQRYQKFRAIGSITEAEG